MSDPMERLKAALADRYAIERELGRGGMATVYLAEDLKHHRKVAVKVLRPELAAALGSERFLREIEVTAGLTHPHILTLHDSGEADGFLYYVMPYISGESLRQRMNRETQLPIEDALRITEQVAAALDYAHRQIVIHRDIKPENILLHEGEAVVADFGIALAVSAAGGERLTETGLSLGTPAYMSPEQVAGEREIDARSDIYSLGCVLYEMLAGQPPFTGAKAQVVLARHVTDPVPPITTARPSVPETLAEVLTRSLAKAPADRFESAKLFSQGLRVEQASHVALATEAAPKNKSIVVLPFDNLSPDPENAFFADGLTEELIADLSKVQQLNVISRTSAFAFKDKTQTVPAIAHQLNVRYLLEGSVRRAGNNLRITAQLIDSQTDTHLWAEKYSGTLDDVFDLQERLSRRIVHELEVRLTSDEDRRLAARPLDDVEAHDIWLRARQSALTQTNEDLYRAEQLVEEALDLVGDNALLHATLGWIHTVRFSSVAEEADEVIALAQHHAAKAMQLDPDLAWAHFVTGAVHHRRGNIQEFVNCLKRAVAIERDSHVLAVLAIYLPSSGKIVAARHFAEEAKARDPLSWVTAFAGATVEVFDGRAAQVLDGLRTAWQRFAYNEPWSTFELGFAALQAGQEDEAAERFRHIVTGDNPMYSSLGQLYVAAVKGDRQHVVDVVSDPNVQRLVRKYGSTCAAVASCLARVGESDRALDWMEQAVERGFTNHRFLAECDPLLAPLRGHPRFQSLIERAREKERALVV